MIKKARALRCTFLADFLSKLKRGEAVNINASNNSDAKKTALYYAVELGNIAIARARP